MRLFRKQPLAAAVVTGAVWWVWLIPVLMRGWGFTGYTALDILLGLAGTMSLSVVLGWCRIRAGSIWAASALHAAVGAAGGTLVFLVYTGVPEVVYVSPLGAFVLLPLAALSVWIGVAGRLRGPLPRLAAREAIQGVSD